MEIEILATKPTAISVSLIKCAQSFGQLGSGYFGLQNKKKHITLKQVLKSRWVLSDLFEIAINHILLSSIPQSTL